jgi:hypothetical protein
MEEVMGRKVKWTPVPGYADFESVKVMANIHYDRTYVRKVRHIRSGEEGVTHIGGSIDEYLLVGNYYALRWIFGHKFMFDNGYALTIPEIPLHPPTFP